MAPLRILIFAIYEAALPVFYSCMLLVLAISAFALISTEMFAGIDDELFGDFTRAHFSLFQASTGDAWASGIVHRILNGDHTTNKPNSGLVQLFFIIFMMLVGVVLMNVLIAQLLDSFLSTVTRERRNEIREQVQSLLITIPSTK